MGGALARREGEFGEGGPAGRREGRRERENGEGVVRKKKKKTEMWVPFDGSWYRVLI